MDGWQNISVLNMRKAKIKKRKFPLATDEMHRHAEQMPIFIISTTQFLLHSFPLSSIPFVKSCGDSSPWRWLAWQVICSRPLTATHLPVAVTCCISIWAAICIVWKELLPQSLSVMWQKDPQEYRIRSFRMPQAIFVIYFSLDESCNILRAFFAWKMKDSIEKQKKPTFFILGVSCRIFIPSEENVQFFKEENRNIFAWWENDVLQL